MRASARPRSTTSVCHIPKTQLNSSSAIHSAQSSWSAPTTPSTTPLWTNVTLHPTAWQPASAKLCHAKMAAPALSSRPDHSSARAQSASLAPPAMSRTFAARALADQTAFACQCNSAAQLNPTAHASRTRRSVSLATRTASQIHAWAHTTRTCTSQPDSATTCTSSARATDHISSSAQLHSSSMLTSSNATGRMPNKFIIYNVVKPLFEFYFYQFFSSYQLLNILVAVLVLGPVRTF